MPLPPQFAGNLRTPRILSAIAEDDPRLPPPPYVAVQDRPPAWPTGAASKKKLWTSSSSAQLEDGDPPPSRWRNHKQVARRGGCKRLVIIALLVTLALLALILGLVLGLRTKNAHSDAEETTPAPQATSFPAGAYSISSFLTNVTTACTSNAATWLCYPYTIYADSSTASTAAWDWIIEPRDNSPNFVVSSTANVFSIVFSNATLSLEDPGLPSEHYAFSIAIPKTTKPREALTDANVQATCSFNDARLAAKLYTKAGSDTEPSTANTTIQGQTYMPWPYRVDIVQTSSSGADAVECADARGQSLGDFNVKAGQECRCLYQTNPE